MDDIACVHRLGESFSRLRRSLVLSSESLALSLNYFRIKEKMDAPHPAPLHKPHPKMFFPIVLKNILNRLRGCALHTHLHPPSGAMPGSHSAARPSARDDRVSRQGNFRSARKEVVLILV